MLGLSVFLKVCSIIVAFANITVGGYVFYHGIFLLIKYLNTEEATIGFVVVYFQMTSFLIYIGLLLLIGTIKANQKYLSLYLLLSCLTWFVLTILILTRLLTGVPLSEGGAKTQEQLEELEYATYIERIKYSLGLAAIWCGQLGVYTFYKQVVEKHKINTGESYVNAAVHS